MSVVNLLGECLYSVIFSWARTKTSPPCLSDQVCREAKKLYEKLNFLFFIEVYVYFTPSKAKIKNYLSARHQDIKRVPGINKIKNINYLYKNKSKNYIDLTIDKRKQKKIKIYSLLKKNNQTHQIICFFVISRYNFHY